MVARTIGLLFIGSMILVTFAPSVVALPGRAALLDFIAKHEAPDGYDSVHATIQEALPMPLTQMSLGEVLAWQKRIRPQAVSTAVGRYQFIHKTLARLARDHDVDPDRVFDESLQDELANRLLDDCGYGERQLAPFANCLAKTWAALPVVTGQGAGRSAWHGVAGNRALVTWDEFVGFLMGNSSTTAGRSTVSANIENRRTDRGMIDVHMARSRIRFDEIRRTTERNTEQAKDNGTLEESVVVKFTLDPYRTQ